MAQTSGQEEAMTDSSQVERLVQHVQRLPQRDEYWVGTHRLARMWVTPRNAPPYRPYVTLGDFRKRASYVRGGMLR